METDLGKIRRLARKKEDENLKFRSFLKSCNGEKIDKIVHRLVAEVSAQIDCSKCMNCCKEFLPSLDQADIERMARGLEISPEQFKQQYLVQEKGSPGYTFKTKPCPILRDNRCSLEAYQPGDCKTYPHLDKSGFITRLTAVISNCSVCPIAFNVYEELKREVWHRRGQKR